MEMPKATMQVEAIFGLAYFFAYLGYLFIRPESEILHWLSLVILPFILIFFFQKQKKHEPPLRASFASVGLAKGNLTNGLLWSAALGLGLGLLQLLLSRHSQKIWELIVSGKALVLFPLTLLLMFLTAGFTEEFFFRGVLQTRLAALFRSRFWAVIAASIMFGIYHLPYAYLNPNWPSHGDWAKAFSAALGQGIPAGLILGTLYALTKNNLLACALVHALINTPWAMTMIRFNKP